MKKFVVYCTEIYNGVKEVEAESSEEAVKKVQEMIWNDLKSVNWEFGEATADFAEEVKG